MWHDAREEAANAALSETLADYGMSGVSLVGIHGGVPDVYLVARGVRVTLGTKPAGRRRELVEQLGARLDGGLCEVAVGVLLPPELAEDGAPTTTPGLKEGLRSARLAVLVRSMSGDDGVIRIEDVNASQLPGVVRAHAGDALDDGTLADAVDRVSDSVDGFVSRIARRPDAESVAADVEEVLDGAD